MSRAVMQQAILLCQWIDETPHQRGSINGMAAQVKHALEQALAEPEQEPVAWLVYTEGGTSAYVTDNPNDLVGAYRALPLYTAPTPRKPLSDEQIALIVGECAASAYQHDDFSFARAIERKHGIGEQHE